MRGRRRHGTEGLGQPLTTGRAREGHPLGGDEGGVIGRVTADFDAVIVVFRLAAGPKSARSDVWEDLTYGLQITQTKK